MATKHSTTKAALAKATTAQRLRIMIETLDALDSAKGGPGLDLDRDNLTTFAERFGIPYLAVALIEDFWITREQLEDWTQWSDRELFLTLLDAARTGEV